MADDHKYQALLWSHPLSGQPAVTADATLPEIRHQATMSGEMCVLKWYAMVDLPDVTSFPSFNYHYFPHVVEGT